MSIKRDPEELAKKLAQGAGLSTPVTLNSLTGGKNNRVYRALHTGGETTILKLYHNDIRDRRDRLGAEWAFLNHAAACSVSCVPTPLKCDVAAKAALYTEIPGRKLDAGEITERHVRQAAEFICEVNKTKGSAKDLEPASEACFSIADHLSIIDRRVARLNQLDKQAVHISDATQIVDQLIRPIWHSLRNTIVNSVKDLDKKLDENREIASPSDFGFHNALWDDKSGLSFIDFEYSGRDDPAKLIGDFFAVPEIPTPSEQFDAFVSVLNNAGLMTDEDEERVRLLRQAYRVKWACIVMNDFLPQGATRRAFSLAEEHADKRAFRELQQLDKVQSLLVVN